MEMEGFYKYLGLRVKCKWCQEVFFEFYGCLGDWGHGFKGFLGVLGVVRVCIVNIYFSKNGGIQS